MRRFLIKVNGVTYDVEVEDADQAALKTTTAASATTPAAAPVPAPAEKPASKPQPPSPAAPVKSGSETIKAPMPGTILSIQVSTGQPVKKNQVLLVLEAMKMENEIVTPRDGVIAGIHTSKGSSVNAGDLLVSLE